jgi:hypothetical protein
MTGMSDEAWGFMTELPPCRCTEAGRWRITNGCDLHNPFTGLLVEQPAQFTGFLSMLGGERDGET